MSDLQVHALTAGELAYLRTRYPGARTQLYLAIWPIMNDAHVYTLRVNGAPASDDRVYEVDYDRDGLGAGVAADFNRCLDDMTVLIGTTQYDYDVGIVRLRGFAGGADEDAGTMEIGEISEIEWADNLYLTIIDDFGLWPRHVYINPATEVVYMDRDVVYTDQHQYPDPVPNLGPNAVSYYDGILGGANTVEVDFDASDSWALDGGALTYTWTLTGASATVGLATATPTATYDTPGVYRADCIVSRNYGGGNISTFTGYRYIHVFDDTSQPVKKFELMSCDGDRGSGGWMFRVKMWDEARLSEIMDRARVILFARDWYGSTEVSIGPILSATHGAMRTNILCDGWVSGESIAHDNENGWVEFEVTGPKSWIDEMNGFPHGIEDYAGAPTDWWEFEDLTVDKGIWSFLHWRSTATRIMDIYLTGDVREFERTRNDVGSLWSQLVRSAEDTILAQCCCDRYGRLVVEIPANLVPEADRGTIPTVMAITTTDWREQIDIERVTVTPVSMLDLSGVSYVAGVGSAFFSLSYGHIFGHYGAMLKRDRLALFAVQADNNELAGLVLGHLNNDYPNVDHRLSANNRTMDICPRQYITQSLVESDTERGIVWTNKNLIPTRVSFVYDRVNGAMLSDVTSEGETFEQISTDGDIPATPPDPEPPDDPPGPTPPPDEIPDWTGPIKACVAWTQNQLAYTDDLLEHHTLSACTAGTAGVALHDTTVDFVSLGVAVGDVVENLTSGAYEHTTVVAVVSPTELTLNAGINLVNTNEYQICGAQWVDIDDGTPSGTIIQFLWVQTGIATCGGWLLTDEGVYWAANILTPSPTWTLMLSLADMRTLTTNNAAEFRGMHGMALDPAFLIVNVNCKPNATAVASQWGAVYTLNTGGAWARSTFVVGASIQWLAWYFDIEVEEQSGDIWCVKGSYSATAAHKPFMYRSVNKGVTFTKTGAAAITAGAFLDETWRGDIYVPYNTPATAYLSCNTPDNGGPITNPMKTVNTGGSFAQIGPPAGYTALWWTKGGAGGWWDDSNDFYTFFILGGSEWLCRSGDGGVADWTAIGRERDLFSFVVGAHTGQWSVTPETWKPEKETLIWTAIVPDTLPWDEPRIRYTDDNGGVGLNHWSNMTGNWLAVMGNWAGASGASTKNGNCGCIPLPRIGSNEYVP